MNYTDIFKIYGTEYKNNTIRLLEAADLASEIPSADIRIGIKPNLVSPSPASYGATTHPEICEGILLYLKEHGFDNIVILEGSWVGDRTKDAFDVCGYTKLADMYGVRLIDTQTDKAKKRDCAGMELSLCRCVDTVDFLINVPVLKGHCQTKMTCALKNMKGLIPNSEKRRFHQLGLHRPIAHLGAAIRQDFIVVDHICGDPTFEDGGNPLVTDEIWAGKDPVLIDACACDVLGIRPDEVDYLMMAQKMGVGCADFAKARIMVLDPTSPGCSDSDRSDRVLKNSDPDNSRLPERECAGSDSKEDGGSSRAAYAAEGDLSSESMRERRLVELKAKVEDIDCCSACYGQLLPVLDRLKEEGLLDRLSEKIHVGQGYKGCNGTLGVGNCTIFHDHYIIGCPPKQERIYEGLKKYIETGSIGRF